MVLVVSPAAGARPDQARRLRAWRICLEEPADTPAAPRQSVLRRLRRLEPGGARQRVDASGLIDPYSFGVIPPMNGQEPMPAALNSGPVAPWKPLVVCPHGEIGRRMAASLREVGLDPPVVIAEYPRIGSMAALAAQKGANICFLDAASNGEHAQVLISELAPAMPVIALLVRNDADLILRCLRRGACDFSPKPARMHCAVSSSAWAAAALRPHTGLPGRSGAWSRASPVAAPARWPFIWRFRRAPGTKPFCWSIPIPLAASAAFLLKLKPEFHLGDMVRDWKRMDQDLWGRLTLSACGIDVLAAPEDPTVRFDVGPPGGRCLRLLARALSDRRARSGRCTLGGGQRVRQDGRSHPAGHDQRTRRPADHAPALSCLDQAGADRSRLRLVLNRYTPATGLKREDVHKALAVEPFADTVQRLRDHSVGAARRPPAPSRARVSRAERAGSLRSIAGQTRRAPKSTPRGSAPSSRASKASSGKIAPELRANANIGQQAPMLGLIQRNPR